MILLQRPAVCATMRKASGCHPTGFSNPNDRISIIMAKYIVIHGIRIDKDYQNFVPETFGRLTTIGPKFLLRKGNVGQSEALQVCQCSCEAKTTFVVTYNSLRKNHTKSCGCLVSETIIKRSTLHGKTNTNTYKIWKGIKQRCTNKNNKSAHNYIDIGVSMCDRWQEPKGKGYLNFLEDMGPRPGPGYSVDRYPVKEGNYEPGNCRWATQTEQGRNRRNNRSITAFGQTKCMAEWLEIYEMNRATFVSRLRKGMSPEVALTAPIQKNRGRNASN